VPEAGISLRKLKKFHFGKTRFAKLKENSFEETSETKECPHCLESGLAITDVNSSGNFAIIAAICRASRRRDGICGDVIQSSTRSEKDINANGHLN
jgi:hypothetical protein